MKEEDIARLSKGIKLKKQVESLDAQIENVKKANIIKLFKTQGWSYSYKEVNFDIPIENHPYSDKAREFIEAYVAFLEQRKIDIQVEFDNL